MALNTYSMFVIFLVSLLSIFSGSNAAIISSVSNTTPTGSPTEKTSTRAPKPSGTVFPAGASATTTLLPAIHWDHDPSNLNHIDPQPSGSFYYAEQPGTINPNLGGKIAQVTSNFTYPSVILEHSGFINQVTCIPSEYDPSAIGLVISFSSQVAYQSAKSNWAQQADLVLITYIPECGAPDGDQRSFWKISSLNYDDKELNIHTAAKEIPLEESVKELDLEWGTYEPANQNETSLESRELLSNLAPRVDVSKSFNINLGPPGRLVSTPFGQAYQLFRYSKNTKNSKEYVAGYCVDCGIHGTVTLSGKVSLSIIKGITSAQIGVNGRLSAGLYFGIDAQSNYGPPPYKQQLASVTLAGLSVPAIFSIGPTVTLGVELSASVNSQGQALLGASLEWPNYSATLDLVHGRNSKTSGLSPQINSKFQASGSITASASIGLPISFGIGFSVPAIRLRKEVEVIDRPGLESSLTFDFRTSPAAGLTGSCDNGISSSLIFRNDLYINVFDVKQLNIWNYKSSPITRCKKFRRFVPETLDATAKPTRRSRRASNRAIYLPLTPGDDDAST